VCEKKLHYSTKEVTKLHEFCTEKSLCNTPIDVLVNSVAQATDKVQVVCEMNESFTVQRLRCTIRNYGEAEPSIDVINKTSTFFSAATNW